MQSLRMESTFESQRATALRWRESTAGERIARIKRLRAATLANREAFHDAFARDFAKPPAEVEASELLPVMDEMRHVIRRLRGWMRPRRARSAMPGVSRTLARRCSGVSTKRMPPKLSRASPPSSSRGARSTSATRFPASSSSSAATMPERPPPTTTISLR
jgi:acyl-CoA reductase-like NAD-dependent aldehyde dehydrogenase